MSVKRIVLWGLVASIGVLAALVKFGGLKIDQDGSGLPARLTFKEEPGAHDKVLEESRAAQKAVPDAPKVVEAAAPAPAAPPAAVSVPWGDFRGPDRLGISREPILTQWPSGGLKRLWKQPVGSGWASFIVAAGKLYTIEQRRGNEVVAAYDAATGKELWTNAWPAHFDESMGGDGPRATPVYDEGRVYAVGAEGELRCLDAASGKVIWNKNTLKETCAANITWAQSYTPLVVGEKLIALPGGSNGRSVVAYEKSTGKTLWSSQNDEQSYTSPMIAKLAGKQQLVVVSASRAMGLTIDEGRLLWEYPWVTEYNINAAQPIVTGPDRFFISAGYGHGAALVALTAAGDKFDAKTVWQNTKMKNKFQSSVLHDGHVYGLDEGILACVNAATGDQTWKGGRYGYGQLVLASGHLVVLAENGDLALVKADPAKHTELARFSAIEGKTWAYPAIADGVVYVRNTREMAAYKIGVN